MAGKLFESFLLTGLNIRKYGHIKTCKQLAQEGAKALTIDEDRAKGAVAILDETIFRKISKVEAQARNYMKRVTVPWSSSRNNDNGSRISGNEYLLRPDILVEYEQNMTKYRQNWEEVLEKELFNKWDKFRSEALTDLNGMFQEHFIPLDELRKRWEWKVWIKPLLDQSNIASDVRIKAPQEVIDRAVAEAGQQQAERISNAVGSIADSVMKEVREIVDGIDSFVYHDGDSRTGNHLPKAKGWEKLERMAGRIDQWTQALDDQSLTDAASQIRNLVAEIRQLGDGSLKDARAVLSGEDDSKRQDVRKKLTDIQDTTAPAMNRLEDFLG